MAKKPMKAPPKGGKVVKRAMGGPMPQGLQPGGPPPGMPSQSAMQQMAARPMSQAGMAAAQAAQLAGPGGLRGGPPSPPPPMRGAGGMRSAGAGAQFMKKGGKVKKMASGGSTKKRPYDAMRDESSRAIDAMPYTEKPKPPPKKAEPKKPAPKTRPYDAVKDEPTSRPFKKGGKVKMAAGGKVYSGTFAEAFRAARKDGVSNFKWAGKKGTTFTTEMEGEAKRPPKAAAPAPAPAKKPPTFGETVARAAGFRGEKKPEPPSSGAANRAAYKDMMSKSAEARGEETKRRAAETVARNKAEDARREAQRQRDNARTGPVIDLNPFASKEESAAARAKATSVRNAVSRKAKGGKVKTKKRYV